MSEHFIQFHNLPLIYGRVPKVANSSVKAALTRLLLQPPEEGFRTTADAFWRRGTNGETTMITAEQALQRRSSHFIFSFVRNPFDRLVSAYNNKLIENDSLTPAMERMGLRLHMHFQHFLEVIASTADEDLDVHLLPQTSILCLDGATVPSFIGMMESMASHWQLLRARMSQAGLPPLGKLPTKNVRRTSGNDIGNYFCNDSLIRLALERYRQDVELFYGDHQLEQLARGQLSATPKPLERFAAGLRL